MNKTLISLFSGAGGLDLGFKLAGFQTTYANEYDKTIWQTFEKNFPEVLFVKDDIRKLNINTIPHALGMIGGPPCQSWSEAGALRGINDDRGKLFFDYIKILKAKNPLFFVAENVSGILHARHATAFRNIIQGFLDIGYTVSYTKLNAKYYNVPQDRERVFIVGFLNGIKFTFPEVNTNLITLKDCICDLHGKEKIFNRTNLDPLNHEFYDANFSSIYMSRNRVRGWDEQSFTIQAGGRHAPIHPQAPKMEFIEQDKRAFKSGSEHLYRRLTVRECARIQTFPDSFKFSYTNVLDGYKMVGNAVPVNLAFAIAKQVLRYL